MKRVWKQDCVGGKPARAAKPPRQAAGLNDPWSDGSLGVYHPAKHDRAVKPARKKRGKAK